MTGHVRRRGRQSFELKFDAGADPITGRRLTRYRSFKGTRREAELELARLVAAAADGTSVDPSKVTVSEFLDRWERDWAAGNVERKTLERYVEILKLHVRPHIGARPIQKIRPVTLAELYAKLLRSGRGADRGLAPRTVGHVHRVLHRAFGHAAQWGVLTQNVVSLVDPPMVRSTEIRILTADQIGEVLQKLRGRSIYMIAALALATGMRRGELLALRWKDVDLDAAKLRVEQSLEQTKAGVRFKAPKTKHGRRTITLPASTVAELRARRAAQQEQRLKLGQGRAPADSLVFATWDGCTRTANGLTKEWQNAVAKLKLPKVTLHALRHTHASLLIASGLDVLTISRRLGHSNATVTLNVYGHLFSNTGAWAADIIEAALAKARTE
jgi:integrase